MPTAIRWTPVRSGLQEQKVYFEGCRRLSDRDFLLIPAEEPNMTFGGHYITMLPRPVFYTARARSRDSRWSSRSRNMARSITSARRRTRWRCCSKEKALHVAGHPRTKGSTGYPDAVRESEHFRSDRYLGASWESLPVDLSEQRLCEKRCFGRVGRHEQLGRARST